MPQGTQRVRIPVETGICTPARDSSAPILVSRGGEGYPSLDRLWASHPPPSPLSQLQSSLPQTHPRGGWRE